MTIEGPNHVKPEYRIPLTEVLWQLADDDLVIAFRASEWLGLAPHIEADVAFASIAQDEMGHATMYFELLEALGEGSRDDLAHLRPSAERRNAVLLEIPNGSGSYLHEPHFDWAFTVCRHYLYDVFEALRLEALTQSSYLPLRQVAQKAIREEVYHLAHQELWLRQLAEHSKLTRARLVDGLSQAMSWAGDLTWAAPWQAAFEEFSLVPGYRALQQRWRDAIDRKFREWGLPLLKAEMPLNGRDGRHTRHLDDVLSTLSEVYRLDPTAKW